MVISIDYYSKMLFFSVEKQLRVSSCTVLNKNIIAIFSVIDHGTITSVRSIHVKYHCDLFFNRHWHNNYRPIDKGGEMIENESLKFIR